MWSGWRAGDDEPGEAHDGGASGEAHDGGGADVEYDLDDWTPAQRLDLDDLLTRIGIAHSWEGATVVVSDAHEAEVEQLVSELSVAHGHTRPAAPALDGDEDLAVPGEVDDEVDDDEEDEDEDDDGAALALPWEDEEPERWVEVEVEVAWFGPRLVGGLIDAAVMAALVIPWEPVRSNAWAILGVTAAYMVVAVAGFGRTPGMLAAGTRVVDGEALLPTWGAATWRWLLPAALGLAAGVVPAELGWSTEARAAAAAAAVVVVLGPILLNGDRRGLHDTAADTYVVVDRPEPDDGDGPDGRDDHAGAVGAPEPADDEGLDTGD